MDDSLSRVIEFLGGPNHSFWLESTEFKTVIRKSKRQHPTTGEYVSCLNVAYVEVSCEATGIGVFRLWLHQLLENLKSTPVFGALYLERVSTAAIAQHFRDHGWLETKYHPPSFFLKL